jgi:hypothetical protein
MPVKIEIQGDDARHAQREMLDLLRGTAAYNYDLREHLSLAQNEWLIPNRTTATPQSSTKIAEQEIATSSGHVTMPVSNEIVEEAAEVTKRERGKPSPGKARRTKEEIAEDEAADKADAENIVDESGESSGMSISSGDERINPEEEAQDAADEAAETERNGGMPARERLRKALGSLGIKAGVEAVKPGGLIGMTIDQVPEDQIEAMIAKIEAAKIGNATASHVTADKNDPVVSRNAATATKDDLMQAMLDYAEVFDGTRDSQQAKNAAVDCGKIFQDVFKNEEISKLKLVPEDGYDKAIAGIKEAIEKNPFKRERKG